MTALVPVVIGDSRVLIAYRRLVLCLTEREPAPAGLVHDGPPTIIVDKIEDQNNAACCFIGVTSSL